MSAVQIVVDGGATWLDYVVGVGTLGAAVFAGVAARTARDANRATRAIVGLETARDEQRRDEVLSHHPRRVSLELGSRSLADENGGAVGQDLQMIVLNPTPDPMFKCRLKMIAGDATWGPQLIGTIGPGERVLAAARLFTTVDVANTNGLVRFVDIHGNAWVVEARGPFRPDEPSADAWVAEHSNWIRNPLRPEERGTVIGGSVVGWDYFDDWLEELDDAESWPGSNA